MSYVSIVLGILALLGYVVIVLIWAGSPLIFWTSVGASVMATVSGYLSKETPIGKTGFILGIIAVSVGLLMIAWLTPISTPDVSFLILE